MLGHIVGLFVIYGGILGWSKKVENLKPDPIGDFDSLRKPDWKKPEHKEVKPELNLKLRPNPMLSQIVSAGECFNALRFTKSCQKIS